MPHWKCGDKLKRAESEVHYLPADPGCGPWADPGEHPGVYLRVNPGVDQRFKPGVDLQVVKGSVQGGPEVDPRQDPGVDLWGGCRGWIQGCQRETRLRDFLPSVVDKFEAVLEHEPGMVRIRVGDLSAVSGVTHAHASSDPAQGRTVRVDERYEALASEYTFLQWCHPNQATTHRGSLSVKGKTWIPKNSQSVGHEKRFLAG